MRCPDCSQNTVYHDENYDVLWCPHCRKVFSCSTDEDGKNTLFFCLGENNSQVAPGSKVFYTGEDGNDTLWVRSFSPAGIVLALITAGWLFITAFAFTIHVGLALVFSAIGLFLILGSISALYSKIMLTYCPSTKEIIYSKGPFSWWRSILKFKAADLESVGEGAKSGLFKDIPCPAVFFKKRRFRNFLDIFISLLGGQFWVLFKKPEPFQLLDFTANEVKCFCLWCWLYVCLIRD